MRQINYERAKKLTSHDIRFFYSIYEYRCLSEKQAYDYFYEEAYVSLETFRRAKISKWVKNELIEVIEYKEQKAIFLTNNAIEIIREEFGLSTNIVDSEKKVVRRGYYSAAELKMLPRLINHQVHLNQFVLDFKALAEEYGVNWKHYGEKFVSQYFGMRPDALLKFYGVDIFLEQDMSTESRVQLLAKWEGYRTFLRSNEAQGNTRKIIMLFIIDGTKSVEKRKDLVRYTAGDSLIDLLGDKFDIYVGTRSELLDILFSNIIPSLQMMNTMHSKLMKVMSEKHGFVIRDAARLRNFLVETEYSFMIYKTTEEGNLLSENGRIQEYLLDDATGCPFSMISKIAYHKRNSSAFFRENNRHISTIFIVDSEEEVKRHLKLSSLMGTDEIYFTTFNRLTKKDFSKALFQFDRSGAMYHFADPGLIKREFTIY